MTIGKETVHVFVNKFNDHVQPNDKHPTVDESIKYKDKIELVAFDILGLLRSTVILANACPITGLRKRMTCFEFFNRVFDTSAFDALFLPSVRVVVVCIDRYGARRIEKTATTISRKRSRVVGQPEFIPLPPGQTRYFEDDLPMPGELSDIFECPHIKAEFYEYLTKTFVSERIRRRIPEGKHIVFSCGVHIDPETRRVEILHPLEITCTSVRSMVECDNSGISEGDLDVWYWALYVYPKMHVHIHSFDFDVLFVGLMLIRRLLMGFLDRIIWFITRRSSKSRPPTEREVRRRTSSAQQRVNDYDHTLWKTEGDVAESYRVAGKMFNSEAASSTSVSTAFRAVPIWKELFFDVPAICRLLCDEAKDRLSTHGLTMLNPVEVNIIALLLSSEKHDYIQTRAISPGVGTQFVWSAFSKNLWRFSDLIQLTIPEGTDGMHTVYHYSINVKALRDFSTTIYDEKGSKTIKDTRFPSVQALHKLAAQCIWTMQYWGNGTLPGYTVTNGTTLNIPDGRSIFGYTSAGWADSVCDDTVIDMYRSCPMIEKIIT